ncbi:hypothetical protein BGZ65_006706 [Modicella reniformis]|uniref:Uncharacterized protein n=1 Tax=Modicella reniformis TaxID=1440133 RepID=A0A9P6JH73_9FUNG|nr:hypothetical protein BGZ65_006706 [Modicella reniformis]
MENAYEEYNIQRQRAKANNGIQMGMLQLNKEAGESIAQGSRKAPPSWPSTLTPSAPSNLKAPSTSVPSSSSAHTSSSNVTDRTVSRSASRKTKKIMEIACSASSTSASITSTLCDVNAGKQIDQHCTLAGQKHSRDSLGEQDGSSKKAARDTEDDQDEDQYSATVTGEELGDNPDTFFTSPTEYQRREYLLQELSNGRKFPIYDRPDYTFNLPLGERDWGPQLTSIYNTTRRKADLTHNDLNDIAVLSGVLHVDEEHQHFSKDDIQQIRRDVLQIFYTKAQEEDVRRAKAARSHWVTWFENWSSIELSASLASEQGDKNTLDTTPVIDSIMAAYEDCKAKNILPVLFMALHVFRKFNTWSKLRSEADCAMAMVGPILEEVLHIQHEVKFGSANFTTAHGKERKQDLGQQGTSRQPDVVGCTEGGKEIYFGELKGTHASKQDLNVDILRLTIFAKDALDHLHCFLREDPPLLTFKTKGRAVVFYLATKRGNAIVHSRVSAVDLPSKLSELDLNQEFFFRLFQVQTLLGVSKEYLKNRREKKLQDHHPFPTLGTPDRLQAMKSPSKKAKKAQ